MEHSIYRYIIRHSLRSQIVLTVIAIASFPFLYAFYELPKQIVNRVIQGDTGDFPAVVFGVPFSQLEYLFTLCGVFLLLVVANQGFKYAINVLAGRTGERMLRRLRYDLYARVLRFPLPHFRKLSQGEIITMVTAEVEPLGGFIGDAFKLPIFQGGYLLVILAFLLVQNWVMAAAAVALYPLQFYIVPEAPAPRELLRQGTGAARAAAVRPHRGDGVRSPGDSAATTPPATSGPPCPPASATSTSCG